MKKSNRPSIPHNHLIDKVAFISVALSAVALYPQLYTLIKFADISGLSSISFGLICANSILWLWYGIHRNIFPIIISSLFNVIASCAILFYLLK